MNDISEKEYLEHYDASKYERPSVASDLAVFTVTQTAEDNYRKLAEKELRILLVKRSEHPYRGKWSLPGGFVRARETVEETASRVLAEKAGVAGVYCEQLYTFSTPERDPRMRVISCAHMALVNSDALSVKATSEVQDAEWFKVELRDDADSFFISLSHDSDLLTGEVVKGDKPSDYVIDENDGLAFDHAKIIAYAVERLRNKLDYTAIAFNLLPDNFTLTELQQIYEVILNKQLLAPAFRRKIAPLVEETGRYTENAGHRPSQLFRLKDARKTY